LNGVCSLRTKEGRELIRLFGILISISRIASLNLEGNCSDSDTDCDIDRSIIPAFVNDSDSSDTDSAGSCRNLDPTRCSSSDNSVISDSRARSAFVSLVTDCSDAVIVSVIISLIAFFAPTNDTS
jgi:hypothetical protein